MGKLKCDKDEISEAKIELWRICGESTLGKLVKRQGSGKSKSELNDICIALKKLSENGSMPMLLGTSFMVSKTHIFNTDANNSENVALTTRLQTLEESINSFMAFSSDRTIITSTNNTLSSKSAITKVGDTIYKEEEWPKVADLDDRQWSTVVANRNKNSKTRQVPQQNFNAEKTKTWRKNLNLLHGTALGNSEGESTLSADVDLVAYGIAKHVTSIQLSKFLEEKGLDVLQATDNI